MGIKQSPNIAQEIVEDIFCDMKPSMCILMMLASSMTHGLNNMATLDIVFQPLEDNGFTMNPLKCECAVKETNWLGYWL